MKLLSPSNQDRFTLDNVGIGNTAVHRTHRRARLVIVEPHALSAFFRYDVENPVRDRWVFGSVKVPFHAALVNSGVGALGFTGPTVDTLTGDHRGHAKLFSLRWMRKPSIYVILQC